MRLNEEYIKRHNLNVPVVLYDHNSNVFLRTKDAPCRWGVFSVSWRTGHNSPGHYLAAFNFVKHDGCESREFFCCDDSIVGNRYVSWEDYETYILQTSRMLREKGWEVVPAQERTLALWQMFLYAYDSWVSRNVGEDNRFYELVEKSTRKDFDINSRIAAFRSAARIISVHDCARDVLQSQLLPMASGHSKWLEKLINE